MRPMKHRCRILIRAAEELLERLREFCRDHDGEIIIGRFEGAYYLNSKGEITVAVQTVPASTALTGKLAFTSNINGSVAGPIGAISASDPAAAPSLSADGQSYNFTSLPSGTVTLTWNDPAGKVASFSCDFTDQVVETITGAFGPAAPGTTA